MTKALLMAIGLVIAQQAFAGSTTGSINVRLVIYSRCEVNSVRSPSSPQVDCGRQSSAQPRVTQTVLKRQGSRTTNDRLVTIEW
ncbi:hypothetical protein C7434_2816 [Pantoea sp. PNA 14-12]|uniref:hypothetical protein n=1 Tax=Pantoea TaxID=53335 RepID=UPI000D770223|nr:MULTISPECIES: hypothetical protein [Pantoea]PXV76370.1 hypothetical protein C7433_10243 [Pantoea sp. PNA 03-3]TDS69416.1 hypothetical protein C7434_2816 [Pantoea sp. PNA 14-12]